MKSRIAFAFVGFLAFGLSSRGHATGPDGGAGAAHRSGPYILGADISWVQEDESEGSTYYDQGRKKDVFQILKDYGFNYIRLRVFVNPASPRGYAAGSKEPFCDGAHTLAMAKRVRAAGMGLLVDFHYSDTWADPGKQFKPAAWENLDFPALKKALYDHTHAVLTALEKQGTRPDMAQIGNEVTNGMLWPDGRAKDHFDNFSELLKSGVAAARAVDPAIRIVLHHDKGNDNKAVRRWLDNLISRGVRFDIIGLSCNSDGPVESWKNNFNDLALRYPQYGLLAAEYSYRKRALNDVVFHAPDRRGIGSFIWEPTRHHEAIFDQNGHNAGAGTQRRPRSTPRAAPSPAAAPAHHPRTGRFDTNELINLYPKMATDYGLRVNHSQLLSYHDDSAGQRPVRTAEDWAVRRRQIIAGMEQAMGKLPDRSALPPLEVTIGERVQGDGFLRLAVSYATDENQRVPAYLFLPKDRPAGRRTAAILALHQTTPAGKKEVAGESGNPDLAYAKELAQRGYVVLAPDYPSFGDYPYDFRTSKYASGTMKGIFNHMRGIDVLQARPEVDPQRIGVIGHSLGGHNAMFLGAFDPRIKVVVSSCGWTSFHDYFHGDLRGWTSDRYMPRIRDAYQCDPDRVPFEFCEVVAALAPRAFFSSSPTADDNFAVDGVRKAAAEAAKVYALLGAAERLRVVHPNCIHAFPAEVRREAYEFIDRNLQHTPSLRVVGATAQPASAPALDPLAQLQTGAQLQSGTACAAFDHLGKIDRQAKAAAACRVTVLYASGLGGEGYSGLPDAAQWDARRKAAAAYVHEAKSLGIPLVLGYLCAASIVDLPKFDAHWDPSLRARFHTPPSAWRQQDKNGRPLPSWYGGAYQPACMNNPDWREYQRYMIRQQLETGHDGIFFDNPTVHTEGCFCPHCMERFAAFLRDRKIAVADASLAGLRKTAEARPQEFLRFRATIAADFLAEMRGYMKSLRPQALLTANNSLNAPDRLYQQIREYGYDIHAMSASEDFVTIEDMTSQPRTLPGGQAIEYGPTYEQLRAITRGRPLVVCTLAEGDYHTPPHLVRLALAEAAAHGASYLLWPTWPEDIRQKMIAAVRPEVDFLGRCRPWLFSARPRCEVMLLLPCRRWTETDVCKASTLAAELSRANVQYEVVCEDDFCLPRLKGAGALLVESSSVLDPREKAVVEEFLRAGGAVVAADADDWLKQIRARTGVPAVTVRDPANVRAVVRDQPRRTLVHLLNLNILRRSSFADEVRPAENVRLTVRVPFASGCTVRAGTADARGTSGILPAEFHRDAGGGTVEFVVPRLEVAAILTLEQAAQ